MNDEIPPSLVSNFDQGFRASEELLAEFITAYQMARHADERAGLPEMVSIGVLAELLYQEVDLNTLASVLTVAIIAIARNTPQP